MTTLAVPTLTELLARTKYLLLDFDGPVCSVFAGRPSRTIAMGLLEVVRAASVPIPPRIENTGDPLEVLRYVATVDAELAARVERALRAAEVDATRTATPTPHADEVIRAWRRGGRRAAIVSNNSSAAITAYLSAHGVDTDVVMGRTSPDPSLLKPSPHLVVEAMRALDTDPHREAYVLLGDSVSDVTAARGAGISSIGYANAEGKRQALSDAGADIVIDNMVTLRDAATASR
jgi:phosphoglycolate phosphatase-like HAD superfamily hydrolase